MDDKPVPQPPATVIDGPAGRLATLRREGRAPGLLWLGGYASDMRGTKAAAVDAHAATRGLGYVRFDYAGHGESDGAFEDGTISSWLADARHVLHTQTEGPQILIGSSMGAWIALLLLREAPERVGGMILIAPAPDFATELTPTQWPEARWNRLQQEGRIDVPSEYDDSVMVYTKAMFDDGATQRVLNAPLHARCSVRILSGMKDDVVPYAHALRLAEHLQGDDIVLTLTRSGDHRMSGEADLERLRLAIDELSGAGGSAP